MTTISLVLNGKQEDSKTDKDVVEAADNSIIKSGGRGFGKKRTNTIGLIISDVTYIFSNLAKGVEDECNRQDWNLILYNTNDKHSRVILHTGPGR
ncbi:MAG: hypothetical protein ACLTBV_16505 [Enterocloster bolteae]